MHYVKKAILPFIFLFFSAFICYVLLKVEIFWLRLTLFFLNMFLYLFIVSMCAFQEGDKAVKVRHENNVYRMRTIETGEYFPIDRKNEFKLYKGFIMGLFVCIPMILFLFVHLIILLCGGTLPTFCGITKIIYYVFYGIIENIFDPEKTSLYLVFTSLYALVVMSLTTGIGYYLGGKKRQKEYDIAKSLNNQIYGEQN